MIWPNHIRLVSLPSLVFCVLFLWNALVYLSFARMTRPVLGFQMKYLYFGLTCLSLAFYSFGTFNLYSSEDLAAAMHWQRWQLACTIPIFIFFILFSAEHLHLRGFYLRKVMPLTTLLFFPWVFIGNLFFQPVLQAKNFVIFSYSTHILEAKAGIVAILYFIWLVPSLVYLGVLYVRYYEHHEDRVSILVAFILFGLAAVNDILVASSTYRFYYLLEFGFLACILAMSFQLFNDFVSASRQLLVKTEEVHRLNDEMNFLVRTISHDFRAPLISIQGFAQLLTNSVEGQSEKPRNYLKRISDNSDRMLELLEDLSVYLKIERLPREVQKVNLCSISQEAWETLVPTKFPSAQAEWVWDCSSWLASEKRLRQIAMNLLENALKYSTSGHEWVRVRACLKEEGLLFTFEDRGPGIPKDLHFKVFEPFFREKQEVPGTGLGLSIVKKAVEDMRGRVWIDAEHSPGTKVCVWLPKG